MPGLIETTAVACPKRATLAGVVVFEVIVVAADGRGGLRKVSSVISKC